MNPQPILESIDRFCQEQEELKKARMAPSKPVPKKEYIHCLCGCTCGVAFYEEHTLTKKHFRKLAELRLNEK